ncbi:MAG: hypothetical protein PHQ25_03335 [Acidobacteriota bacterium]|nr:hypothetical protein [Acidobacteriota bacterium]MDW3228751.1 hypothetical protein [Acidobacteriota bacterium]
MSLVFTGSRVAGKQDFPKFKMLNVIAEINSYHISDGRRWPTKGRLVL